MVIHGREQWIQQAENKDHDKLDRNELRNFVQRYARQSSELALYHDGQERERRGQMDRSLYRFRSDA